MSLKQTRAVVMHRWNIKCLTDLLNRSEILVFVSSIYLASKGWSISEQCSICTNIEQSKRQLLRWFNDCNYLIALQFTHPGYHSACGRSVRKKGLK